MFARGKDRLPDELLGDRGPSGVGERSTESQALEEKTGIAGSGRAPEIRIEIGHGSPDQELKPRIDDRGLQRDRLCVSARGENNLAAAVEELGGAIGVCGRIEELGDGAHRRQVAGKIVEGKRRERRRPANREGDSRRGDHGDSPPPPERPGSLMAPPPGADKVDAQGHAPYSTHTPRSRHMRAWPLFPYYPIIVVGPPGPRKEEWGDATSRPLS